MRKIIIASVYFGPLPKWFDLWVKSCEFNNNIDFLLVTDQQPKTKIRNLKIVNHTLESFKVLAESKLEHKIVLDRPYKICDYKPMFGVILEEYFSGYDYWGHSDLDVIYGDLTYFFKKFNLERYDKFLPLGHLCLYKNSEECKKRYVLEADIWNRFEVTVSTNRITIFDEQDGINSIYEKYNFPYFDKILFADIGIVHNRFCLSMNAKNYKYQAFYWEDGKILKAYEEKIGVIEEEEYIYIHFQSRNLDIIDKIENSFYISNEGFIAKNNVGIPDINAIKKINNYPGMGTEIIEMIKYSIKSRPKWRRLKRIFKYKLSKILGKPII